MTSRTKPLSTVDRPDWRQAGQFGLVGLAFAVAGWLFYAHFTRSDFKVNPRPFASLGEFAADELVKLLPAGRVQVFYDVSNRAAGEDPRLGKALEMQAVQALAFKARLAGRGKFSFEPDVKLPRSAMAMSSAWPSGAFQSLAKVADTTLVLFSSLPDLGEAERKWVRQRAGKLVVVGMALPEIQPAVQAQLVQLAIAYRVPVPKSSAGSERPAEWVQRVFAVVTPESRSP